MLRCSFRWTWAAWCVAACLGCGGTPAGPTGGGGQAEPREGRLVVAAIPKSTGGEFWETVERGAKQAGVDLDVEVRWEGTLTETEIAEQNKIIENMVTMGVDGIALAPLNNRAQRKSVESAVTGGIPVVVFDSDLDGQSHVSFVATDNIAGGKLGAERMAAQLGDAKRVLVLRYVQGTASTENRAQGFMETARGLGMEILADPYPEDGTVAGCKKTAANVLEGYVQDNVLQLDGIFACNLTSALGMESALADLRKSGVEVKVCAIGFDSSPKLVEALQAGDIDSLVVQSPYRMGYLAVETLSKHLRGETVETRIDTGVQVVTRERLNNEPEIRELVGL